MKTLQIIIFLGLANFCIGQADCIRCPTEKTINAFQNYLSKKDKEELSLHCVPDTVINSKDSIVINFRKPNKSIFKTAKLYFHTGYVINVHKVKDSFVFSDIINDTTVLKSVLVNYYHTSGKIIFGYLKEFSPSIGCDMPCYGCITLFISDIPYDTTYNRTIYNQSNKPLLKIYYQNKGDDSGFRRIKYSYDKKGKQIAKKEEIITINQFWDE